MMKTSDSPADISDHGALSTNAYFDKLSFCGILTRTVSVYKTGFVTLNKINAAACGTFMILWALLLLGLVPAFGVTGDGSQEDVQENFPALMLLFFLELLIALPFGIIGHAAMVRATADVYLQRPAATMRSYVGVGWKWFTSNLVASILMCLGVALGLVLFIVPGIYIGILWILTHAAIVIEQMGPIAGMKRSKSLVSGQWCFVFGIKFLVGFTIMVVTRLWNAFVAPPHFSFFGFIVGMIPSAIAAPFLSILVTVLYIHLRVDKEGLDAQALGNDLGEPTTTATDGEGELTSNENSDSDDDMVDVSVPQIC